MSFIYQRIAQSAHIIYVWVAELWIEHEEFEGGSVTGE